jgi:hypothetical protein
VLFVYGLVILVLLVYCVLDILTTPREAVRTLPKPLWLLVALAPVFGPVAWFLAGRPERGSTTRQPLGRSPRSEPVPPPAPDDDEEFLRQLRKRAEEQRRRSQDPRDD